MAAAPNSKAWLSLFQVQTSENEINEERKGTTLAHYGSLDFLQLSGINSSRSMSFSGKQLDDRAFRTSSWSPLFS
jgi:hypothetical protein